MKQRATLATRGKVGKRKSKTHRRGLTRSKVIDAAAVMIDRTGAQAFSLRELAHSLRVTPMALYNHFDSRHSLLAATAEHIISATVFDSDHADWRDRVRHCFNVFRGLCLKHPGLPGLLETPGVAPTSVFAPMNVTIRALTEAGLDDLNAMRTYFLLVSFTLGQTSYQIRGPFQDLEPGSSSTWDFDSAFAFGIELILRGVEVHCSTPRGSASTSKSSRPANAAGVRKKKIASTDEFPSARRFHK
jgi:TetR/AcrR family tetracycline transcriptional repressor